MLSDVTKKASAFLTYFLNRYMPAIVTLLVLAGGFYFYFNVIVSGNEAALKERSFRGLNRIANNVSGKMANYTERNAANFLSALKEKNLPEKGSADTLQLSKDYGLTVWRREKGDTGTPKAVGFKSEWRLYFRDRYDSVAFAPAFAFAEPFLRRDLFSHYLLTYGDTVLFDELNISSRSRAGFAKTKSKPDTTKSAVAQAGETYTLSIGGKDYKLFLLSFTGQDNHAYTLGGYIPLDKYIAEERYIPTYAIIWMVIGLLMVLLMFPLLKIFLMQRSEQLLARDAIASMATLHITGAIAVLIALNVYVYFTFVTPTADKTLRDLAKSTTDLFLNELDAALVEMDSSEASVNSNLPGNRLVRRPAVQDSSVADADSTARKPYLPGSVYPYFERMVWADNTGRQVHTWTTKNYIPQQINVSDRDYFEAVKNDNLWRRNNHEFYLTAITSWVSKQKLLVISKRSRFAGSPQPGAGSPVMMSLSSAFRSLFNAQVPEGYGFCLVKPNGEVVFHIDQNRSLNENLVEECNGNGALQSLLQTRSEGCTGVRYSGASQRLYTMPVTGLPFSVVFFRDMRITWSEDLDVIAACSILCLMNLAVILLAILIIQLSGYRHSLLQNQSILFTWLRPRKALGKAYASVTTFFVVSMILQIVSFFFYNEETLFLAEDRLCLIGIAFSYSFLLLCYMFYHFAVKNAQSASEQMRNKWPVRLLIIFYLFVTSVFTISLQSGKVYFIASQLTLIGIGACLTFAGEWKKKLRQKKWLGLKKHLTEERLAALEKILKWQRLRILQRRLTLKRNFRWWYIMSLFSFVAATGITPILVFFCISFKEERLLSLKHTQLAFANELAQRPADPLAGFGQIFTPGYAQPYHYRNFAERLRLTNEPITPPPNAMDGFDNLYKAIKPSFSDHSREMEFLIRDQHPAGNDFYWTYGASDTVNFHYRVPYKASVTGSKGLRFESDMKLTLKETGLTMWKAWRSTILLIGALLLLLKAFDFLLKRLVQRIFFEGYQESSPEDKSDLPYVNFIPKDENVFVIGPVNSGKHQQTKLILSGRELNIIEKDLAALVPKKGKGIAAEIEEEATVFLEAQKQLPLEERKRTIVLLRHFEFGMNDFLLGEAKLELLEELLQKGHQIIILSSRSVDAMPVRDAATGKDLSGRWSNAINQFYNLYHRWSKPANDLEIKTLEAVRKDLKENGWAKIKAELPPVSKAGEQGLFENQMQHFYNKEVDHFLDKLNRECAHSDFLWSLRPALFNHIQKHKELCLGFNFQDNTSQHMRSIISRHFTTQFEKLCLKIQSLAANYYLAIWQSLNPEEQRTLLDIGTDDLVNPANRIFAIRLANMGLVIPEPDIACYQLMNVSFRNFVFTQLNKAELKTLRTNADGRGSWNSFELPVLTVVLALGIFLFTTQKDAFTNLLTYLGAAAGGIAALLKLLGMIPSSKT